MVDARIAQTQSVLAIAILDLASERPISEISVSDITRAANINRATFYNHYGSVGALLASVISLELDEIREADHVLHGRAELTQEDIARRAVGATIALVERHRRVFELALLDSRDIALHRALAAHFEISVRQHLENWATPTPVTDTTIIARFVGGGIVGAIEGWLASPPMSTEQVTDAIMESMPRWWH